jgi:RNA polymerase sigma-70 factor (ECF subfamily)
VTTCYHLTGLPDGIATDAPESVARYAALARGDAEAVREAYRAHHEAVRAFARRLLGSDADAEEIVQEVFVGLPRAVQRFRGDCSFSTLVMSLAVNQARHWMRAAGRRRSAHARFAEEQLRAGGALPDEATVREQLARQLQRAMLALTDEHRLVFVLCEVEERSSSDVALMLRIPASTVRSRLVKARASLRALLTEAGEP